MTRAAVFGTGSWGTTFSMVLCDAGVETMLWGRRPDLVDNINTWNVNPDYLPGIMLPEALRATTDPAAALEGASFVILAVPAQHLRACLARWAPLIPRTALLVSLMKGIELGSCKRMSEVTREVVGAGEREVAVVSGPNLALEIAERQPTATVIACPDQERAKWLQNVCHTSYFRPYTNTDVVGCELGGAVKNIIALAVGMAAGMGFGDNAKASLITRGLAEIARLGAVLGADQHTFAGLAGLGDLVATCNSPLSRNRSFGESLGRGMTLDRVVAATRQVAEGVKSSESVLDLARKHDVEMPITEAMNAVMHQGLTPREALQLLMTRTAKPERYGHDR